MRTFNHQLITKHNSNHVEADYGEFTEVASISEYQFDFETAQQYVFELAAEYWQIYDKDDEELAQHQMDHDFINARLAVFFSEIQNQHKLFQYLLFHREITGSSLIHILFGKTIQLTQKRLAKILVIEADNHYIVQPIFIQHAAADYATFAMKTEAVFTHYSLTQIREPAQLLLTFKTALAVNNTTNRVATIIHQLVEYLAVNNPKSFVLKQMHIFNVLTHFTSGRRHFKKLRKLITQIQEEWQSDQWALTEKEKTLLAYILMSEAYARRDDNETIMYGAYIFRNNQINNHAVEILVEYNHFLSSHKPQMNSLIKDYTANYLEYGFYMMINTLARTQQFTHAYELLCEYEAASSTSIYRVLNVRTKTQQDYEMIESAVQQDIDQMIHDTGEAWEVLSNLPKHKIDLVTKRSSKYISNLAKIMFVIGEIELYELLKKICYTYILIPAHMEQLEEFVDDFGWETK